jgi:hypothetical protein
MITIFLNASGANDYPLSSNDDETPIAIAVPALEEAIMAPPEQPHRPWLVPGWGTL